MDNFHRIDIKTVLQTKNPKLYKIVPNFILNYLKKIIHQDDLNNLLLTNKELYSHDFVKEIVRYFDLKIISIGIENLPISGSCILVCNHPLGGLDGIAVMNEVSKKREDLKALVNDLLLNLTNIKKLLIPINKMGKNSFQNSKRIDEVFASDECIILFPAGLVSRKQNGKIKDLEWKKSFVTKAIKYKSNVIPVHIEAENSNFFYNLARLRKKLHINVNLEMFFLVDEVYKQKGKDITLTFGKPIPYTVFTKNRTHNEWSNNVKEYIYTLKHNPLLEFKE